MEEITISEAMETVSGTYLEVDEVIAALSTVEGKEEEEDANDIIQGLGGFEGESLIPESEFEDYAERLAEDVSGTDLNEWPFYAIDWEIAARDLQSDFTAFEIDGETYYVR